MRRLYIALILLFLYTPIVVLVALSFNDSKYYVTFGGFTLRWYRNLLTDETIRNALWTTLFVSVVSAFAATVIGTLGAIGIQQMRIRNIALSVSDIPLLNADIVTGVSMMLLLVRFTELNTMTVLVAHITFEIPYVMLNVMPRFYHMDRDLYNAALDLGADNAYAIRKVILPELLPGIIAGFLMAVTMSIDDFSITYFTRGAGINTLSTMIYTELKRGVNPSMYALSTILFAVVFLLLVIMNVKTANRRVAKKIPV